MIFDSYVSLPEGKSERTFQTSHEIWRVGICRTCGAGNNRYPRGYDDVNALNICGSMSPISIILSVVCQNCQNMFENSTILKVQIMLVLWTSWIGWRFHAKIRKNDVHPIFGIHSWDRPASSSAYPFCWISWIDKKTPLKTTTKCEELLWWFLEMGDRQKPLVSFGFNTKMV